MFRNHITTALRNLLRNKVYSGINIGGLAMAMSCVTIIYLYVESELSFDRFHSHSENIYRIVKDFVNEEGTSVPDATTPPALAPAIRQELPEVDHVTRMFPNRGRLY